jgi:hypothetical protein
MKIRIEAQSQEEFDEKRVELMKAIAGSRFDLSVKPKPRSRYDRERSSLEPRTPHYKAQAEMLDFHDRNFDRMLAELKREIREILMEEGENIE